MKLAAVLLVLCACGSAKPRAAEALVTPEPATRRPPIRGFAPLTPPPEPVAWEPGPEPIPELALDKRWPLPITEHPELEPHFPIAAELAEPGVGWLDLCRMGAQHRVIPNKQELVDYLGAWCKALSHDEAAAIEQLAPLLRSSRRGMPAAVRLDIAAILVQRNAADALHALHEAAITDAEIGDLLSAFYMDTNQPKAAAELTEYASEADTSPSEATRCHRIARRVSVGAEYVPARIVKELAQYVAQDCVQLAPAIECRMYLNGERRFAQCDDYAKASARDKRLFDVYAIWPSQPAPCWAWRNVSEAAIRLKTDAEYEEIWDAISRATARMNCTP